MRVRLIIIVAFMMFSFRVPSYAEVASGYIAGVWEADTPGGKFEILSVVAYKSDYDYRLIILDPGFLIDEYEFQTGELLAKLEPDGYLKWKAEEKFRFPIWAGGGSYMGETEYSVDDDDNLLFHTDDEAAIYSDYKFSKIADGIKAAGVWKSTDDVYDLKFILVPLADGTWEGRFLTLSLPDSAFSHLENGDAILRGKIPPDPRPVDVEFLKGNVDIANSYVIDWEWVDLRLAMPDTDELVLSYGEVAESNLVLLDFERIY